jgi:hypothetical protein
MAKLCIRTPNGQVVEAPIEAWIVALIRTLDTATQHHVLAAVSQLDGASVIPDKYFFREDELGTIQIVERPLVDFGTKL